MTCETCKANQIQTAKLMKKLGPSHPDFRKFYTKAMEHWRICLGTKANERP